MPTPHSQTKTQPQITQSTPTPLPPAQPAYILRGHASPIHTLLFYRDNLRLLSGDAAGWSVIWDLPTKRPVAVWQAHEGTVLGATVWGRGGERIITHGRDSRIIVWQITIKDEAHLSKQLPVEHATSPRPLPWILHSLEVSTLNFCSFASCVAARKKSTSSPQEWKTQSDRGLDEKIAAPEGNVWDPGDMDSSSIIATCVTNRASVDEARGDDEKDIEQEQDDGEPLLLAVAGSEQSTISIYALPSEQQVAAIPAPSPASGKTGMVMALRLFYQERPDTSFTRNTNESRKASSALTVIAGYESGRVFVFTQVSVIMGDNSRMEERGGNSAGKWQITYTARPHEQPLLSLAISPALDVFYTSGADTIIARHPLLTAPQDTSPNTVKNKTPIQEEDAQPKPTQPSSILTKQKEIKTGHSGQQGLTLRSDGRIFATAGWDGRARVYSAKSMKELAVLRWHKEGCYATAFADIGEQYRGRGEDFGHKDGKVRRQAVEDDHRDQQSVRKFGDNGGGSMTVREAREKKAMTMHWLAVGSKDAKITLWDIY